MVYWGLVDEEDLDFDNKLLKIFNYQPQGLYFKDGQLLKAWFALDNFKFSEVFTKNPRVELDQIRKFEIKK